MDKEKDHKMWSFSLCRVYFQFEDEEINIFPDVPGPARRRQHRLGRLPWGWRQTAAAAVRGRHGAGILVESNRPSARCFLEQVQNLFQLGFFHANHNGDAPFAEKPAGGVKNRDEYAVFIELPDHVAVVLSLEHGQNQFAVGHRCPSFCGLWLRS